MILQDRLESDPHGPSDGYRKQSCRVEHQWPREKPAVDLARVAATRWFGRIGKKCAHRSPLAGLLGNSGIALRDNI
jgi:hypothetical protein